MFSADGFIRYVRYWVQGLRRCKPFRKTCSLDILNHLPPALIAIAGHFGEVQPGFFVASSDSNLGEVYIIGFLKVCSLLWYKI